MSISVEIVSAWYNESTLAPFFLKHYEYADTIHILLDMDSDDSTLDILEKASNVVIHPITYPDGIDWEIKSSTINKMAISCKSDWVIAVDADEFIWPIDRMHDVRGWLSEQAGTMISAAMFTVYRHHTEGPLDPLNPSVFQRRHGDSRVGMSYNQHGYIKPCIARPETGIQWSCGIHSYKPDDKIIENAEPMFGTHWCMADADMAVRRRIGTMVRQSRNNIEKNHGYQNFKITEAEIRKECFEHEHDRKLF